MGYSEKPKSKASGASRHDYDSSVWKRKRAWPDSGEDSDSHQLSADIGDLGDAIDDLHQLLSRVCEMTEHLAMLLCGNLYPANYPEFRYTSEDSPREEPPTRYRFCGEREDVPF